MLVDAGIRSSEARLLATLGTHYLTHPRKITPWIASAVDSAILELLTDKEAPDQEREALRTDLDVVLGRLPERCRSILRLRYGLGHGGGEAAASTGYRASNTRKVPSRCLAGLCLLLLGTASEPVPTADESPESGAINSREQEPDKEAAADPFHGLKSVVSATADLRTASGRLSARKVADTFGLSLAELSRLLKRSRQAVSKTADAESMQPALASFERAARLRAILSDDDFRRWLRMPNDQLDNLSPLDVIRGGQAREIADLVEDMLTGNAT